MVVVVCSRRVEKLLARDARLPLDGDAKHRLGSDRGLLVTPLPLLMLLPLPLLPLPPPAMPLLIAAINTVNSTMVRIPLPVWPSRLAMRPAMTTPACAATTAYIFGEGFPSRRQNVRYKGGTKILARETVDQVLPRQAQHGY